MVLALACTTGNLSLPDPAISLVLASTTRGVHQELSPMEAASNHLYALNLTCTPRRWMALVLVTTSSLTQCRLDTERVAVLSTQLGEQDVNKNLHQTRESRHSTLLDLPITTMSSMTRGNLLNLIRMKASPSLTL